VFNATPEVAYIFQSFNKACSVRQTLRQFVRHEVKNVIWYADGCIDSTARIAHSLLPGLCHYVIQTNDRHEIRNYREGIALADALGCRYALLLQDDDIYTEEIFDWVRSAICHMQRDDSIALVGGNGGANYVAGYCKKADVGLATAKFETFEANGKNRFRLGNYQEMEISSATAKSEPRCEFVATVNRAPQLIRIHLAKKLRFFPVELEPFQYDDDYNCLAAWLAGYKVLHFPTACKTGNVGIGGMRLYNNVSRNSRPEHFCRNWNHFLDCFGDAINVGQIDRLVAAANGL
jgi:hypothetical protein